MLLRFEEYGAPSQPRLGGSSIYAMHRCDAAIQISHRIHFSFDENIKTVTVLRTLADFILYPSCAPIFYIYHEEHQ
jgi:hypothetical protein